MTLHKQAFYTVRPQGNLKLTKLTGQGLRAPPEHHDVKCDATCGQPSVYYLTRCCLLVISW
jgi:hypothetical protein